MCLFLYPAPKTKKRSKKSKKQVASGENIQEAEFRIADEALRQGLWTAEAAAMPHPHGYWVPFGAEQRFEEYEPGYITKGQWASYNETLKGTLSAAKENGNKIDGLKAFVSNGMTEARDAMKSTHGAIKGTHFAINDTYTAVEDVHNTLKATYEAMKKNHGEHTDKQDECAAEIARVRELLEEEAKRREEAHRKQQNIEEAWNYYRFFREAEQDAEPKSSRSSSSSSGGRYNGGTPRRRQAHSEDRHEHDGRHHHPDQDLKRAVRECFNEFVDEARFYPCNADACGGWHHHHHPHFRSWDNLSDSYVEDDIRQHRSPHPHRRHAHNVARGNRRPRHFPGWT
ncbi:hypothetical protein F5Y05DRAFT_398321 [Hypoxylon sp. FL0543]|nr:hypothetical protein F5Y05DRAFT_398321 [Hypoxylon sp. FL0543]